MDNNSYSNLGVVLLSAGSTKEKMPGFPIYKTSPAFLPINSRSLGKIVIDFYLKHGIQSVYLVVNQDDYEFAKEEFGCFENLIKIIGVTDSNSITDTIEKTLPFVNESDIIINIITSIPNILISEPNCIGLNEKMTPIEGWAGVKLTNANLTFMTKKESLGQEAYSFSGIFRSNKIDIEKAALEIKNEDRKDLISIIKKIHDSKKMSVVHFSWFDCGRVQNYFKTRSKIIGSRYFNSISLDSQKGTLTKRSSNKDKLIREIKYVQQLPSNLSIFFPRIIKTEDQNNFASVEMEYYAYPTLAEIMLYWDLPKSIWEDIFNSLGNTLSHFYEHKGELKKGSWHEIYVKKVQERVSDFYNQLEPNMREKLFKHDVININGSTLLPWEKLKHYLEELYLAFENQRDCSIVHGDFCFNNILCEPYVGLIKLLDARGSFGESLVGIFGDRKYDWAKLGHSVIGRYDYIVNDLFSVNYDEIQFQIKTYDRPWQETLDNQFLKQLTLQNLSKGQILFIIGTLFISMPPLHADNPKRQIAFFLKGIQFMNEGLNALGKI